MNKIIILIGFLIIISGCEIEDQEIENECDNDTECILVINSNECCFTCLDTYDYATNDIIARNREEHNEWISENCEGVPCPSCPPNYLNQNNYEAKCIENQCVKEAI
jgi:hypothetical protein